MSNLYEADLFPTWTTIPEPRYRATLQPELVQPAAVNRPELYKRFQDLTEKDAFRSKLTSAIEGWIDELAESTADGIALQNQFRSLLKVVDDQGALMLGGVSDPTIFRELVDRYDAMMQLQGNATFLHNFVDVRSHSEILLDETVNESFLHPLFVSIIAYRVGGPVRLVDVRAKDAEPISVLAQDNMLHIDNTPFNDEYKVLLTWERGTTRGPNGQNFTYLPGTHKLARQSQVDSDGVWSSENCSIFTTEASVRAALSAQAAANGADQPKIIEVTGSDVPVSTVFPAGSLVHHRYRTSAGQSRSCIIAAFHRVKDNPGALIAARRDSAPGLPSLLTSDSTSSEDLFIEALRVKAADLVQLIRRISTGQVAELSSAQVAMPPSRFPEWFAAVTNAPLVSSLRAQDLPPANRSLGEDELLDALQRRIMFDKHGPIDLVLYADNHEEVRKWARNSLRELNARNIRDIALPFIDLVSTVSEENVLGAERVAMLLQQTADEFDRESRLEKDLSNLAHLTTADSIDFSMLHASIVTFTRDLAQAITRTDGRDAFRSTSLFAFLAVDTISRISASNSSSMTVRMLWMHYCVLALAD
ncbi:hypothetical protein [Rathayibacter festucae]|uniref:hypothetical protein n=1 Tax=Rathayibacter festucae TaxID=110937 RepID=UPI002A6B7C1F|nr:hypothetical protein [Rathayibacter festucae]MDY0913660.1 hypothetical protein [Rathayibacter festucae]